MGWLCVYRNNLLHSIDPSGCVRREKGDRAPMCIYGAWASRQTIRPAMQLPKTTRALHSSSTSADHESVVRIKKIIPFFLYVLLGEMTCVFPLLVGNRKMIHVPPRNRAVVGSMTRIGPRQPLSRSTSKNMYWDEKGCETIHEEKIGFASQ